MRIINLTAHTPTPEQIEAGVVDLPQPLAGQIKSLLDVDVEHLCSLNSREQEHLLSERARLIVELLMEWVMEEVTAKIDAVREQRELPTREIFTLLHTYPLPPIMIGGHPGLMDHLKAQIRKCGAQWHEAQSQRVSVDLPQPDGTVKKISNFVHVGFRPPVEE